MEERISAGKINRKWAVDGENRVENGELVDVLLKMMIGISGAVRTVVWAGVGDIPDDTDLLGERN